MNRTAAHIELFEKLGLTNLQARIYLTVLLLQKAGVGKIAISSDIARPDVYRVLPTLEKIGLVRKVIVTPIMYEATPLKEGCQILLNLKKSELEETEHRSLELIKTFDEKIHRRNGDEGNESFWLINSKMLLIEKISLSESTAKKSIDVIGKWDAIRTLIFSNMEIYQQAINCGVRLRFITDNPRPKEKFIEKLTKKSGPLLELRYLEEQLPIRGAIYDGLTANMCVHTIQDQELTPSLWSNNLEFVNLLLSYFDRLWVQAKKI